MRRVRQSSQSVKQPYTYSGNPWYTFRPIKHKLPTNFMQTTTPKFSNWSTCLIKAISRRLVCVQAVCHTSCWLNSNSSFISRLKRHWKLSQANYCLDYEWSFLLRMGEGPGFWSGDTGRTGYSYCTKDDLSSDSSPAAQRWGRLTKSTHTYLSWVVIPQVLSWYSL